MSHENLICYLCYRHPTSFILTYKPNGHSCLPVCVYCIPPWINGREYWWYEKRIDRNDQTRPSPLEVKQALDQRKQPVETMPAIDEQIQSKSLERNYRAKFHVDELLGHWNEQTERYDFTHERSVWNEATQQYYYPSDLLAQEIIEQSKRLVNMNPESLKYVVQSISTLVPVEQDKKRKIVS